MQIEEIRPLRPFGAVVYLGLAAVVTALPWIAGLEQTGWFRLGCALAVLYLSLGLGLAYFAREKNRLDARRGILLAEDPKVKPISPNPLMASGLGLTMGFSLLVSYLYNGPLHGSYPIHGQPKPTKHSNLLLVLVAQV